MHFSTTVAAFLYFGMLIHLNLTIRHPSASGKRRYAWTSLRIDAVLHRVGMCFLFVKCP